MSTAFYCVTGRDFFPGAVALLNSLRLVGHEEPLHVLDCGLEPRQRRLLAEHAEVIPAPAGGAPSLQKLVAPLARPADTIALLDADMIVIRPLDELLDSARQGRLVGFANESDRYFAEWSQLLDLGPLRRERYLSSGALFAGGGVPERLLEAAQERLARIEDARTWIAGGEPAAEPAAEPLFFADQDVINAVAMARLEPGQVVALETRLAAIPPFAGLRLRDRGRLRCAYGDGSEPFLLHHYFRKPWLVRLRSNPYSRLMSRLLFAPDVRLRLDPRSLPPRLRPGPGGALARAAVDLAVGVPAALRRRLGGGPGEIVAWSDRARRR